MQFKYIIGQSKIKAYLIKCVQNNRIPHAQMFWGAAGIGKLSLALAYAQYLNCTNRTADDSCGKCPSCIQYQKAVHPDLHFVFPYTKIKGKEYCDDFLPEWREMLKNQYFSLQQWLEAIGADNKQGIIYSNESEEILRKLSLKSYESDFKTMIIWLPEKMHESCANKLLKILEEPPSNTVFLLVSEQPELLLSTIISRAQMIHIPNIQADDMKDLFSPEIVRTANGSYLQAKMLLDQKEESQANFILYRMLMAYVFKKDLVSLKKFSEDMVAKGREPIKSFLEYAQHVTRECFIANLQDNTLNYTYPYEAEFTSKFKRFVSIYNIDALTEQFSRASSDIERNVNAKIVFFDLGLQLMTKIKSS